MKSLSKHVYLFKESDSSIKCMLDYGYANVFRNRIIENVTKDKGPRGAAISIAYHVNLQQDDVKPQGNDDCLGGTCITQIRLVYYSIVERYMETHTGTKSQKQREDFTLVLEIVN
ncbi:hypothetical protein V6N13_090670 [Hibiscus sabdariffa]